MSADDLQSLPLSNLLDAALEAAHADATGESKARWAYVRALHWRGDQATFTRAVAWCLSQNPLERVLGADVLAQLGTGKGNASWPFAEESEPILVGMLQDSDDLVVASAMYALGHLSVGNSADLARLAGHQSPDVRHSLAYALGGRDDHVSISTLVSLCGDEDNEVRDWATFGLGSLCQADTPEIRTVLIERLSESDQDIRGEAMVGLARRGDKRASAAVLEELYGDEASGFALEAAESLLELYPDDAELREGFERWRPKE